jgi:pyrimidine-nucleoside phosphorylase
MNPTEIIRKKRSGEKLNREEMTNFINGYLENKVTDYQMSSFLMAVYFQKMDFEETAIFTDIMLHSGIVVDLSSVQGIKVDKHSTGGVGDKVSLILAPMVAVCGVPVPMISGRGLGHTGGTLDKLESIPGFRTNLTLKEYEKVINKTGLVMIGQTSEIAPADKRMYALRDVTATVESIPLIAGSIMSKKLAEGIDALVLDVKSGRGAFMQNEQDAVELAKTLIGVGNQFGKKVIGFITDMNQPLGEAVGNWLEAVECFDCLQGKEISDLMDVTYLLGGAMVMLGGKAKTIEEGMGKCRDAIKSGKAWEKFKELVKEQDGDVSYLENPSKYAKSKHEVVIKSKSSGYVANIDALEVGFVGISLGAGRMRVDEIIDPKAGIIFRKKVGDQVKTGETLAVIFTDRTEVLESAVQRLETAIDISKEIPKSLPIVHSMIDMEGVHQLKISI